VSGERPSAYSEPGHDAGVESLPFTVELWTEDRSAVEAILARVHSVALGQAVFSASRAEYPTRYLTLRRGEKVISESGT
jgi:hypothetical protein